MPRSSDQYPVTDMEDPRYAKALSHPLRVRILSMLEEHDASPVQLAGRLEATLGTVAYHVRTLERLGLVEMVATHQRRGATEHVYALREQPGFSGRAWATTHLMTKNVMVASALSEIGEFVTQSAAAGGFEPDEAQVIRRSVAVDEEGFTALARATERWLKEVDAIARAAGKRLDGTIGNTLDGGVVAMLFRAVPFSVGGAEASRTSRRDGASRDR